MSVSDIMMLSTGIMFVILLILAVAVVAVIDHRNKRIIWKCYRLTNCISKMTIDDMDRDLLEMHLMEYDKIMCIKRKRTLYYSGMTVRKLEELLKQRC